MHKSDLDGEVNLFSVSLEKMWERIKYCNLILESQISDSALNTLSKLVLSEGPLPVGEIGKMLQEACSAISNMSSILKERFGGLKKFIERFPEDFVLANDHPFNPNVYLKSLLLMKNMQQFFRGETLLRQSVSSQNISGSRRRQRNNSRNLHGNQNYNITRKKSPQPSYAFGNDYANVLNNQLSMNGGDVRAIIARTQSSNSLENAFSGNNGFQPRMSLDAIPNENITLGDWESRLRRNTHTASVEARSNLGQLESEPAAPEFFPTWNR